MLNRHALAHGCRRMLRLGTTPAHQVKTTIMEWVSIKPTYNDGIIQQDPAQPVFSLLTKAGFQLEQVRRNVAPEAIEYFYFHPGLHIQVHEVNEAPHHPPRFFIFYPGGSTAYAEGLDQLRLCFAAG
ncbi:hypothetical protein [Chitinophaga sp.]|uniref:hypothetical protein n=1 Tax=Chitinophaga sp. TaxID=1869181 RepID=UPI0031D067FF